jgi:hypothetical protein
MTTTQASEPVTTFRDDSPAITITPVALEERAVT